MPRKLPGGKELAVGPFPWLDPEVHGLRIAVRYISLHTGLPALVVAALLLVIGYRLLKKSARFLVEVTLISLVLLVATHLGWIRW